MEFTEKDEALLMSKIRAYYSRHWNLNDAGHREFHFRDVYATALEILERIGMEEMYDRRAILFAAYFHDLFAWSRHNHHTLAREYFLTTNCNIIKTYCPEHRRPVIAAACEEHRASFPGPYSTKLSELIASADRGRPLDLGTLYERAIAYGESMGHHGEENHERSIKHLKEKFGAKGYCLYPHMYREAYQDQLEIRVGKIEALR